MNYESTADCHLDNIYQKFLQDGRVLYMVLLVLYLLFPLQRKMA